MRYYPIYLDLKGRSVTVVGGGKVAERKVRTLISSHAVVTVISPDLTPRLQKVLAHGEFKYIKRRYRKGDLAGSMMVLVATDDRAANEGIASNIKDTNILINIADIPDKCNFILPSIVERGDLIISISTSGKSPAFAKQTRLELERIFGKEYELFIRILGMVRKRLLETVRSEKRRRSIFQGLVKSDVLMLLKQGKRDEAEILIRNITGLNDIPVR
ncbi:MAG TPA: bifunctional precorrin-2 dehydrogenase/sirohydrochlorin ferrochelatase [Nitrospiria bacterium]|nr:bifunctional precorrin-2 dehydrogenase/sirohydrochlorin ferrochelatase [Nitrospiria bacterium]